jgi:tRNA-(ms[2]io[6]A)-hydroxylase
LLSLHCSDADLRTWYHKFMVAEAGHYKMFIGLAERYFGEDRTRARWKEYLAYEAGVLKDMEVRGDRMH